MRGTRESRVRGFVEYAPRGAKGGSVTDYVDDMLDGLYCECCGESLGDEPVGYMVRCPACRDEDEGEDEPKCEDAT